MKKSNKMIMMTLLAALAIGGCTPKESSSVSNSSPATPSSSKVESTENSSSETLPTINSIVWNGVENAEVQHKKLFGVLAGVSLKATKEGSTEEFSIPAMVLEVSVEGATLSENVVDTTSLSVGDTFKVTYKISETYGYNYAEGVETTKVRTVTVIEASENLVINGDFEDGMTGWDRTPEGTPNSGSFTIESDATGNHYAKVDVTGDSGNSYQPRINTEYESAGYGIRLEPGNNYQLTYKAKADNARKIHVQLGQLLTAEPWFNLLKNTVQSITTEWAEYSLTLEYTGNEVYPDCHVVLECGKVEGEYVAGAVYFDDVAVKVFDDEIPDETAPKFEGVGYLRVDKGATLDLMAGVIAYDDRDGDITDKVTYSIADFTTGAAVDSIDTSVDGKYKVTYKVSDAAGHETTVVRTVRVCDPSAADENAFTAPTAYKNGGESDAVANPGTLYEWHDQEWWCGAKITVNEFKWENNAMILEYTSEGSVWYGMQIFYVCPDVIDGSFSLSFNVESSVACKVTLNGVVKELVVGNNTITVPAPVKGQVGLNTISFQFGEASTSTMVPEGRFVFSNFEAYTA